MPRPTEQAKLLFDYAFKAAKTATLFLEKPKPTPMDTQLGEYNQAAALASLARGLSELAVGLRATYMFLEDLGSRR